MENFLDLISKFNYPEIIASIGIEASVKATYRKCKQLLTIENDNIMSDDIITKLHSNDEEMYKRLQTIIDESWVWSTLIQFRDLKEKKYLNNVFISLDFYVTPKSTHIGDYLEERVSLHEILTTENSHLVIIGGPGAGKTTVTKYITLHCFAKEMILGKVDYNFPLLIRLRELNELNQSSFLTSLLLFIGVDVKTTILRKQHKAPDEKELSKDLEKHKLLIRQFAIGIIDDLNVLLILDGLDEVVNLPLQQTIVQDVRALCLDLKVSKIILTSRTGEFNSVIENAHTLELSPLSDPQINEFIHRWIDDPSLAESLYKQIIDSPFHDTALRPINLAHLCALFLRYGEIPKQPKTVYKKVVHLLIEDWDVQRDIKRIPDYVGFPPDKKKEFLEKLSYNLTYQYRTYIFAKSTLFRAYEEICRDFGLQPGDGVNVFNEIESHTGLFVNSVSDKYEFAHKSLQEYLTAEFISRSSHLMRIWKDTLHMANEYAIALSLSASPSEFLYFMMPQVIHGHEVMEFVQKLVSRLIIEKPDFSSSPYLAGGIAKIFTLMRKDELNHKLFGTLLYLHTNIEDAFRKMSRHYEKTKFQSASSRDDVACQVHRTKVFSNYDQPKIEIVDLNTTMLDWFQSGPVA